MNIEKIPVARTRLIAGAVGGYVWGLVTGLLNGAGFQSSVGVAGYTFLSGALAGLIGHMLYVALPSGTRVVTVARFTAIGAVFFGSQAILIPDTVHFMLFQGRPVLGVAAGAIGGAAGGITYLLFRTLKKRN